MDANIEFFGDKENGFEIDLDMTIGERRKYKKLIEPIYRRTGKGKKAGLEMVTKVYPEHQDPEFLLLKDKIISIKEDGEERDFNMQWFLALKNPMAKYAFKAIEKIKEWNELIENEEEEEEDEEGKS